MEEKRKYTARELAVLSLCRLERQGKYGSLEADAAIKKFGLKDAEKALYTKLFYGVLERRITLDHIISSVSDKPIGSMTLEMKNILRVSCHVCLFHFLIYYHYFAKKLHLHNSHTIYDIYLH